MPRRPSRWVPPPGTGWRAWTATRRSPSPPGAPTGRRAVSAPTSPDLRATAVDRRLQQGGLARVVDEQAVVAQAQARGQAVLFKPPVVQQVPDLRIAYHRDEIGQQTPVA